MIIACFQEFFNIATSELRRIIQNELDKGLNIRHPDFSEVVYSAFQKYYEKVSESFSNTPIACPACRNTSVMNIHGYYTRSFSFGLRGMRIRVMRVRCPECGSTHAVLPEDSLPYHAITYTELMELLNGDEESDSLVISESYINHLRKSFRSIISTDYRSVADSFKRNIHLAYARSPHNVCFLTLLPDT